MLSNGLKQHMDTAKGVKMNFDYLLVTLEGLALRSFFFIPKEKFGFFFKKEKNS